MPQWQNQIVGHADVDPRKLLAHPSNFRLHPPGQRIAVSKAVAEQGWVRTILVNQRSGRILDGHLRVDLSIGAKQKTVPVDYVNLDESAEARILMSLDPLGAMAETDEQRLAALATLFETGFDPILPPVAAVVGQTDEDAAPEPPAVPVTVMGDLWLLGGHRVLCGDSTLIDAAQRLCGEARANLVFTDPPYNVDYEGYTKAKLKIEGDKRSTEEFSQFLLDVFGVYRTVVAEDVSMYVCHSSSSQREFQAAIEAAGFEVRCQIIWAKNTFAWGFGRYKFQHEPIFYCHIAGQKDSWYGDKSQSTLWEEKKPAANRLHPTMKPIALVERALVNSSKAGDLVLDLFGGSGSTLIACEKTGRISCLMELDPKYVDVIVNRWQQFTGKQATLDGDGRTFDEVKAA